jgi:putative endonuclease
MIHTVYILKSETGRYYIGYSSDFEKRLEKHRSGLSYWTSRYKSWMVIRKEEYPTRTEALKRERYLKRLKGGDKFKKIIGIF